MRCVLSGLLFLLRSLEMLSLKRFVLTSVRPCRAIQLYMYARQLFEEQFIQLGFDDDAVDGQLDAIPMSP